MTERTINRVSNLSQADFVRDYLAPLRPVIITDAAPEWGCWSWTPEFFRDQVADRSLGTGYAGREAARPFKQLLQEVLDSREGAPGHYIRNIDIAEWFPELLADVQPRLQYAVDRLQSRLLPRGWVIPDALVELFIGGAGNRFQSLHYDTLHQHAFVCQIYGDKEFTVYEPDQAPFLYPRPEQRDTSAIENVEAPDLTRYPLFAQARPIKVTLKPRETIFMPAGWWHVTKMRMVTISISFNSVTESNWLPFVRDVYDDRRGERPLKSLAVVAYLLAVGAALSVKERLPSR